MNDVHMARVFVVPCFAVIQESSPHVLFGGCFHMIISACAAGSASSCFESQRQQGRYSGESSGGL